MVFFVLPNFCFPQTSYKIYRSSGTRIRYPSNSSVVKIRKISVRLRQSKCRSNQLPGAPGSVLSRRLGVEALFDRSQRRDECGAHSAERTSRSLRD